MDKDIAFIAKVLEVGLGPVREEGIDAAMLFDEGKTAFDYITEFFRQHGKVPDRVTVEGVIGVSLAGPVPEPFKFYADQIKDRHVANLTAAGMKMALSRYEKTDVQGALDEMRSLVMTCDNIRRNASGSVINMAVDTAARFQRYEHVRSLMGTMDGIPTPWPTLDKATWGAHPGELWVLIARLKTGKCGRYDTCVICDKSGQWKTIKEMVEQRLSTCTFDFADGKIKGVTPDDWCDNGVKRCLTLTTRLGYSITATPDHPFLTVDGWKNLEDLRPGEKIAGAAFVPPPTEPVRLPDYAPVALAGLIADGGVSCDCGVTYTKADAAVVGAMRKALGGLDGSLVPKKNRPSSYGIVTTTGDRTKLRAFLVEHGLLGKLSKDKRIPPAIFSAPNDQLAEFLGFLWSGDGIVDKRNGNIAYTSASEGLATDLQRLLLRFGVVSRKRHRVMKYVCANGDCADAWEVAVRGWCRERFIKAIGPYFVGKKKERLVGYQPVTHKMHDYAVRATPKLLGAIQAAVKESGRTWGGFWSAFGWKSDADSRKSSGIRGLVSSATGLIPLNRLKAFVPFFCAQDLAWIVSDDIVWDEVVGVEEAGEHPTYDLTINNTRNFVAEGLVIHNSFAAVLFASHFWQLGKTVAFVSMEMSNTKIERRWDAINFKLPFGNFLRGLLTMDEAIEYQKKLDEMAQRGVPMWVIGRQRVKTVAHLEEVVRETGADIVVLDAMYRLKPRYWRGGDAHEKVSAVADELQELALDVGVPIVATTQFNRKVRKKGKEGQTEDVGFAYEIMQNADVVLRLHRDEDLRAQKKMMVSLMEGRESEEIDLLINWDLDAMDFSEYAVLRGSSMPAPASQKQAPAQKSVQQEIPY